MIESKLKSHEDLVVWQKAMRLIELVYAATSEFPRDELYGLTSQMRRAVTAIPTNITEGLLIEVIKMLTTLIAKLKEKYTELPKP